MELEINNIDKSFGGLHLFRGFNLSVRHGIITCILGPSGCGKSTLLNIIASIMVPDSGEVNGLNGKVISAVFQDPRLLPWKTVRGNIDFVIDRSIEAHERSVMVDSLIDLVDLTGFEDHYPVALSGGMRQRVSIARALAYKSEMILLDEPFKGIDLALKQDLIRRLTANLKEQGQTVLMVTHDVTEALIMGDEIVVLSRPPVQIMAHELYETAPGDREPGTGRYKELEGILVRALGSRQGGSVSVSGDRPAKSR